MVAKQSTEYKDVVIVGAGISGIDSAYRLQTDTDLDYTVFEGRHEIGGTWSLFQFPGIRSDSDMFTLGFPFRPWTHRRVIADGGDICQYVKDTAHEFGIDKRIQFNCKVVGASWSSQEQRWTLTVEERLTKGKPSESTPTRVRQVKTRFVTFASGYFNYAEGHYPKIPGADTFAGPIIKPQWWPEELDFKDKRVVVIGSGATAATIVPNMASRGARHVVMLQRSPTYILSIPGENHIGNLVRKFVPSHMAHSGLRAFSTLQAAVLTTASKLFPGTIRRLVMGLARHQLPKGYDVDKHFNPSYNPWDQRMCIVPDGDFYRTIKEGKSSVVTGHIAEITPLGIKLTDGQEIEADIIVQATGLKLQLIGGSQITVDGEKVKIKEHYAYKSQMLEGVPNLTMVFGYVDASWTLGADLCARYVTRLLNHMKDHGFASATPVLDRSSIKPGKLFSMNSGYFDRAKDDLPLSTDRLPWALRKSAFLDWLRFPFDDITQDMKFVKSNDPVGV